MTTPVLWSLVALGLGLIVVRRRSVAIALVALQSLLLGVAALGEAGGDAADLAVAATVLAAKGLALPALLAVIVRRTREPRRVASERHAIARLIAALAVALAAVELTPPLGLEDGAAERAAVGLLVLGIVTAVLRRPALFQALGFLVAENGLYVAAIATAGGLPAVIELGLLFDLLVIVSVAAAFSARIHEELGTGDTAVLRGLRD